MVKIAPLYSSSKGNATFIGDCNGGILVDVGCSFRALKSALELCDLSLEHIKAVLITHEHSDHIKGLLQLTKQMKIPVFSSEGTINWMLSNNSLYSGTKVYTTEYLDKVPVDMEIHSFQTSHDSVQSVGYTFQINGKKISFCTDLGEVTDTVRKNLSGSYGVFIESNYDNSLLLQNKKYPEYLKRRIASNVGHLSNLASSEFLVQLVNSGTQRVILGHLSQENNTPQTAYQQAVHTLSNNGMIVNEDFTLNIAPVQCTGECIFL